LILIPEAFYADNILCADMNDDKLKYPFQTVMGLILAGLMGLSIILCPQAHAATTLSAIQTAPLTVEASWDNDDGACSIVVCQNIKLDWGDGSPLVTIAPPSDGIATHVYAAPGEYTLAITCSAAAPPAPIACETEETINVTDIYEVRTNPTTSDLTYSQSKTIPITYTLTGGGTFTATSTRGEIVSRGGKVLYRINRTVNIIARNEIGTATETITVPPGVVESAVRGNHVPLFYRRTFRSEGNEAEANMTLRILPSSAGPFSLVRMELNFKRPGQEPLPGRMIKSPTLGRITVPRHTKDLKVLAEITYNGAGTLRAQWRVDGQILGFVNKYLPPGRRRIILESPDVPQIPTFDTGRHQVELEILNPEPEFDEPVIFYYVVRDREGELQKPIRLDFPPELAKLPVSKGAFKGPLFSWAPLEGDVIYRFELHKAESLRENKNQPVVMAQTRGTSYSISAFDVERLSPGFPYAWRVLALDQNQLVGKSGNRVVSFIRPVEAGPVVRFKELQVNGTGPGPDGTAFDVGTSKEYRVVAGLFNEGPDGLKGVRVEFLVEDRLMDVSFIPSIAPGETQVIEGLWELEQALPQKLLIRAFEDGSDGGETLALFEGTLRPSP
jgi:hypothetical protein